MANDAPRPLPRYHEEEGTPASVWLLIWTIYVAKLATIVLVIWIAHDYQATALIAVTTWPWLVLAAALGVGPLIFHVRLRRARARREELRRAEWLLPSTIDAISPPSSR